jgi:hypothetical protein
MQRGPTPADLLDVRDAVDAHATQTVWMHRPELYWKDAARHQLRGIVRLVGEKDRHDGAWPKPSLIRFDTTLRRFMNASMS